MLINEKQLIMLVQTLKDTLVFHERRNGDPFSFGHQTRSNLLEQILSQQSEELQDISR